MSAGGVAGCQLIKSATDHANAMTLNGIPGYRLLRPQFEGPPSFRNRQPGSRRQVGRKPVL
jgi:hypothetical protein